MSMPHDIPFTLPEGFEINPQDLSAALERLGSVESMAEMETVLTQMAMDQKPSRWSRFKNWTSEHHDQIRNAALYALLIFVSAGVGLFGLWLWTVSPLLYYCFAIAMLIAGGVAAVFTW